MRDEAEIRGHRRTYIGALPGTIIRALRARRANNPVFMIDEIDKLGADFRGDPASAMLEVLDPEQNSSFRDHYLDLPFDLSNVMFITTANSLRRSPRRCATAWRSSSSPATRRRKAQIARRYLIPAPVRAQRADEAEDRVQGRGDRRRIKEYTREAGVRNLEREIGSICRKVAREFAEGKAKRKVMVTPARVREILGQAARSSPNRGYARWSPGVVTGTCLDALRRRDPVHRGDGLSRATAC